MIYAVIKERYAGPVLEKVSMEAVPRQTELLKTPIALYKVNHVIWDTTQPTFDVTLVVEKAKIK